MWLHKEIGISSKLHPAMHTEQVNDWTWCGLLFEKFRSLPLLNVWMNLTDLENNSNIKGF